MNGATTSIRPALRRLKLARLAYVALLLISASAYAAELSEEAKAIGKERRDAAIAQAKQQVADLEKQRAAAAKERNMAMVSSLVGQIKQAKAEVTRASKQTVEDYANEDSQNRGDAGGAAKQRLATVSPEILAKLAEAGPLGITRCLIDNNCRLVVEELGSVRATQLGVPPSFPVLRVAIIATSDDAVESYEVACYAFDSFDKQIASSRGELTFTERYTASEGRTLKKGQISELRFYFPREPISHAYKCQAWVSQVRLASGKVWQQTYEEAAAAAGSLVSSERRP